MKGELKLEALWSLRKGLLIGGAILASVPVAWVGQQADPCATKVLYEKDLLGGGWQNGVRGAPPLCRWAQLIK